MKGLRTRKQTNKVFLLSSFDKNERKKLSKQIQSLGGIYMDSESFRCNCTHVVCGKLYKTEKFLGALATGKWILTPKYIEVSFAKNVWLDEETYEWCPEHGTHDCPIPLLVAPKRWRKTVEKTKEFAFKGWKVAVLVGSKSIIFKRLLISGGAEVENLSVPVKNPGKVANKVTYIFTEGKYADILMAQGLMDYGILLLKPEFILAYLLQMSAEPMDYLVSKSSGLADEMSFSYSQDSSSIFTSQDISEANSPVKDTPLKSTKSIHADNVDNSDKTPVTRKVTSDSQLSQRSLEDFFRISRRLSVTPNSSLKQFSQEHRVDPSEISLAFTPVSCCSSIKKQSVNVFHPNISLNFQNNTSDVEISKINNTSNTSSPQCEKSDEKVQLQEGETPAQPTVKRSAKRKLIEETKTDNREIKRIKKYHPENLWKHTFVRWTPNQFTRGDILPSEFPDSLASLIDICVEEKNLLTALDLTQSMLTVSRYPQPRTIHAIITSILENANNSHIAQKAFGVLMSIMNMHPPTTAMMQNVYLTSVQKQDDSCNDAVWKYINHIISNAISEIKCEDTCQKYQLLLQFFTSMFEWNFSHLLFQHKCFAQLGFSKSSLMSCMLVQVLWSPHLDISPNCRTHNLFDRLQECLLLNVPFAKKQHLLELLLNLVSMAAQCCHLADGGSFSGLAEGDRRMAFVFEFARKLAASCLDEQTLQLVLRHLQPSWLCLRVCQILLGFFDDYLLLDKLDEQHITLANIVTQYFFLLPRLVSDKNSTSQREPKVERRKALKTLETRKYNNNLPESKQLNRQPADHTKEILKRKINKRNAKGECLIHRACISNDTQNLEQLLQVPGIDVNVQDNAGWTPLHEACNHGHIQCVEMLLKYVPAKKVDSYFNKDSKSSKVDLLLSTPDGITPLHDAVTCNRIDICRLLLKHGGVRLLTAETSNGFSPADLAKTAEMKNFLNTVQQSLLNDENESWKRNSSQTQTNFPASAQVTDSPRTSYIPPDFLYEQVLATEDGFIKACDKDCTKYVILVMFLLNSYITTTGLLQKNKFQTPRKKNNSTTLIPTDQSEQSYRIQNKAEAKNVKETPSCFSLEQADRSGREDNKHKDYMKEDLYHFRKMKYYLQHFESHLKKLTNKKGYKVLEPKLSCLKWLTFL